MPLSGFLLTPSGLCPFLGQLRSHTLMVGDVRAGRGVFVGPVPHKKPHPAGTPTHHALGWGQVVVVRWILASHSPEPVPNPMLPCPGGLRNASQVLWADPPPPSLCPRAGPLWASKLRHESQGSSKHLSHRTQAYLPATELKWLSLLSPELFSKWMY